MDGIWEYLELMGTPEKHNSRKDTDVGCFKTKKHVKKMYEALKNGRYEVMLSGQAEKKRGSFRFRYTDLLQHATSIGSCNSKKRTEKNKANHRALAKYLARDAAAGAGPSEPSDEVNVLADIDHREVFVWPCIGIVVNIPTSFSNGSHAGESGTTDLRDQLISRGFNPTRVLLLWNHQGHSGTAFVEFDMRCLSGHALG